MNAYPLSKRKGGMGKILFVAVALRLVHMSHGNHLSSQIMDTRFGVSQCLRSEALPILSSDVFSQVGVS